MRILCVDIGTGTQDVLLVDTRLDLENAFKMVVPSPTMIVRRRIQEASRRSKAILLDGVTMGGGPSHWAVEDHLRRGLAVYATPAAARSFNDDLEVLTDQGISVVSEDEAAGLHGVDRITLMDFDLPALETAFGRFGVSLDGLALVAVAVFDHGAAPPDVSDRKFRFETIERRVFAENRLSAFAYPAEEIPADMTRMLAVASSAGEQTCPLMLMDTAPAAVLGASLDPRVRARTDGRLLVANLGNFHTLAFCLGPAGIEGVFEHHTGMMTTDKLDGLLLGLADGSLTDAEVFLDQGHGARIFSGGLSEFPQDDFVVVVVGPRRALMAQSKLRPYFAAPFGDMMMVGCFGMLAAAADLYPHLAEPLHGLLYRRESENRAPWDFSLSA